MCFDVTLINLGFRNVIIPITCYTSTEWNIKALDCDPPFKPSWRQLHVGAETLKKQYISSYYVLWYDSH